MLLSMTLHALWLLWLASHLVSAASGCSNGFLLLSSLGFLSGFGATNILITLEDDLLRGHKVSLDSALALSPRAILRINLIGSSFLHLILTDRLICVIVGVGCLIILLLLDFRL